MSKNTPAPMTQEWLAELRHGFEHPYKAAQVNCDRATFEALLSAAEQHAEMLAALKELMPKGWGKDDTMDHMPGIKRARLAIDKAEGRMTQSTPQTEDRKNAHLIAAAPDLYEACRVQLSTAARHLVAEYLEAFLAMNDTQGLASALHVLLENHDKARDAVAKATPPSSR